MNRLKNPGLARLITAFVLVLALSVAHAELPDPVIDQSRGVDQRIAYTDLLKYRPWDDRNYEVTKEDLEWLSDNELELHPGIPVFFRIELRKEFPHLMDTGPVQYPRAALQMFRLRYGGVMRNGVIVDPPQRPKGEDEAGVTVPVNGELQLNQVLGANEITVEINPADANQVIAGSNNNGGQEMYYSTDGGQSWTIQGVLPNTCCDPTLGWSSDGTVAYVGALSGPLGVSFWRSFDGGQTWVDRVDLTVSGSDKEFLHVDLSPTSPHLDNLYMTYHNGNVMQFARSINQGTTFDITGFPSEPRGIGSDITTDSAGNIYHFYGAFGTQTIELLKSTDGGATFAAASTVTSTNGAFDFPIPAMESRRAWVYATADADRSGGTYDGSIYVSFTDTTGPESSIAADNHTQIHVYYSRDGGATWNSSIPHPTADVNTVDRFNQWMNVDEFGTVHVVYYDTRNSTNRTGVDLYYTFSKDGAQTWNEPTRVSSATSANLTDGQEWGDYNGISAVSDLVVPVWTDNRAGPPNEKDVYAAEMDNLGGEPGFLLLGNNRVQGVCRPGDAATINLEVGAIQGFSNPVTLALLGEPTGVTGSFSVNPVTPATPANTADLTLSVGGDASAGQHIFQITGSATDADDRSLDVDLTVLTAVPGAPTLVSPGDAAVLPSTAPLLTWSGVSESGEYTVEIDDDPGFGSIDYQAMTTGTSHQVETSLDPGTVYSWRVRSQNACGNGSYSTPFSFETGLVICSTPGLSVPDNTPAGVSDSVVIAQSGTLNDLDVAIFATHTWVGDLIFSLVHEETGTTVTLFDRPGVPDTSFGCAEDNIDMVLDDASATPVETSCGLFNAGLFLQPQQPLAGFSGENLAGTWSLQVSDNAGGDTGQLDSWCLINIDVATAGDSDLDGVNDDVDNCPDDSNPGQEDFDGDGFGYVCDATCALDMDIDHHFPAGVFGLEATQTIQYTGAITGAADITLDAGSGVRLNPGTSVTAGALLRIGATGCSQ